MDGIVGAITGFFTGIFSVIPSFLVAILLLVLAFAVATVAKAIIVKLLKSLKAEEKLAKFGVKDSATNSSIQFIGKLVFIIVFLMFLPAVLSRLGLSSISAPIITVVNSFVNFIPNIVATIIIVAVGLFIAKLIKELLIPIFKALKFDVIQAKAGIEVTESNSISVIIANLIYAVLVLLVLVAGLNELGVRAISAPAEMIVNKIFGCIPGVIGAIVVVAIGTFIAKLVSGVLKSILMGVGADSFMEKVTGTAVKFSLSKLVGNVVNYIIIIIFVVQGINLLQLPVLSGIGTSIIAYLPNIISAVVVYVIAIIAANTVDAMISKKCDCAGLKLGAKVAIYVVTAFIILSQLNIANAIVETTFVLIVAGLCAAFAIAFGVGGKGFAQNTLTKLEKKIDEDK